MKYTELQRLEMELDMLCIDAGCKYTQMQRHRDAKHRTRYNLCVSQHLCILADIDKKLKEIEHEEA